MSLLAAPTVLILSQYDSERRFLDFNFMVRGVIIIDNKLARSKDIGSVQRVVHSHAYLALRLLCILLGG
jgi:hypothetical protein